MGKGSIFRRALGAVLGAFVFRLVYTIALRSNQPPYMRKRISSLPFIVAIAGPYFKERKDEFMRIHRAKKEAGNA